MFVADISQEKTIQHIETFDKTSLKHTETVENKGTLPDKQSEFFLNQMDLLQQFWISKQS